MKSHVSIAQKVCIVTGETFDSGEILFDRRLKDSMEKHTITGYGIKPEIQEKIDEGFVVLIEADPEKSEGNTPDKVYRTGNYVFLKKEVSDEIFNVKIKDVAYLEIEAFQHIKSMIE